MKKTFIWSLVAGMMACATMSFAGMDKPKCYPGDYTLTDEVLTVKWATGWGDLAEKADLFLKEEDETFTRIATIIDPKLNSDAWSGQNGTFVVENITDNSVNFCVVLTKGNVISTSDLYTTGGSTPPPPPSANTLSVNCGYEGQSVPVITKDLTIRDANWAVVPCTFTATQEPVNGSVSFSVNSESAKFTYTPNDNNVKNDTFSYQAKDIDNKEVKTETVNITYKSFPAMETEQYYKDHINDFKTSDNKNGVHDWFHYWSISGINGTSNLSGLESLRYYIRVNSLKADDGTPYDLSKIKTYVDEVNNPPNVNRVIRLMPKGAFEQMFPNTVESETVINGFRPGKTYTYLNFLKAVAVMPGYCGDYSGYPESEKTDTMRNKEDVIAKKFLATTFAHAVQETSEPKSGDMGKIHGTFGHVREAGTPGRYLDAGGPFGPGGFLNYLTEGNSYHGRGAKQLSYPSNYANVSLLLYGDLRLVKYPDLVEGENILPFLSAIVYTLVPKSSCPSIAEVMDGSWSKKLMDPVNGATTDFKNTYNRDFPLTVLIVNGGPECNGHTEIGKTGKDYDDERASVERSKSRIDAYNYFSTTCINSGGLLLNNSSDYEYYVENESSVGKDYYRVHNLMSGAINNTSSSNAYEKLFQRLYYYCSEGVVSWDSGIQTFGGMSVKDNIKF